jgi:hypothetical protein
MIIIFTIKYDISTSNVIQWLRYFNQEVIRINGDDDIFKLELIKDEEILFRNTITNKIYNLLEAKSCWWRRNGISRSTFTNHQKENLIYNNHNLSSFIKGEGNILIEETEHLKEYIYLKVYERCKINIGKPLFNLNKLIVLDIAKENGLKVPKYKIITNTKQLDNFESISKAISNGIYKIIYNHSYYSYTEKLNLRKLKTKSVDVYPSIQMELIEKKLEIRSFFIEGNFFSMAIFSQSSEQTKIDFRKYNNKLPNRTEPFKLPISIEDKLKKVFESIELNCGSVDEAV